jgi:hypothetical protein
MMAVFVYTKVGNSMKINRNILMGLKYGSKSDDGRRKSGA